MAICSIEDCDSPRRKREWCDRHYQAWRAHGDPLVRKYAWAAVTAECVACGKPEIAAGMRKFCSVACRQSEYRARVETNAKTQAVSACGSCGVVLTTGRSEGRTIRQRTRRFCDQCRAKPRRSYRLAVDILAHYQGTDCGICGETIDMSVRFPNKRCATVDHIQPIAFGGTDAVTNLRLAHFDCNCRREDFWALAEKQVAE